MFKRKASPFSKPEKALLFLLAAMQFIAIAEFMVMMPLAPILMRDFNFTPTEFGLIVSSYAFSSCFSGLLCSLFVDRFDRRHSLLVLFGGLVIATFLCSLAWGYWPLLLARVFAGLFSGVLGSQIQTVVSETIDPKHRGEALGVVFAAFSLSTVVGVPLGLLLAAKFYWGAPFLFLAFLGLCVWIGCYKKLPSVKKHLERSKSDPFKDMLHLFSSRITQRSLIFTVLTIAATSLVFPFISTYLVENVGVAEDHLYMVYLFGGAATFFTSRLIGRAADYFGTGKVFRIVSLCSIVPLLTVTHLPELPLVEVIAITAGFFILVSGRMPPSVSLITQTVSPEIRGRFLSANSAVQNFSLAVGSYCGSHLVSRSLEGRLIGYGNAGVIGACLIVCSCLWSFKLKKIELKQ